MNVAEYATRLAGSGVSVGPAMVTEKRPAGKWKDRQSKAYLPEEIPAAFKAAEGLCIFCGKVSGSLEMIDFDARAVDFEEWYNRVDKAMPGLVTDLVIERSQSGGRHVVYRALNAEGNQKLCTRVISCEDTETHLFRGKPYPVTRLADGRYVIKPCTIETRGEGGIFLCHPTPGYRLEQGSLTAVKLVSDEERDCMIQTAREMSEEVAQPRKTEPIPARKPSEPVGSRPGDIFNLDGDVEEILSRHGWMMIKGGENSYWRRPGKNKGQHSATLKDGTLYVFSSNAAPFEPGESYSPFAVMSMLEHNGDFEAAAAEIAKTEAFKSVTIKPDLGVDLSGIMNQKPGLKKTPVIEVFSKIPAPMSKQSSYNPANVVMPKDDLDAEIARRTGERKIDWCGLRMPGIVEQMMICTMNCALFPNAAIAFSGAVCMVGALAGRKWRDSTDLRTNLYMVCLAESSQGKESARTFNCKLAEEIGAPDLVRREFASGEGIEDQLVSNPSVLYQVDEIQQMFESMKCTKDARANTMAKKLMELYSSSNKNFPCRSKAGTDAPLQIDQPCLSLYGSSTPTVFYDSLNTVMLHSGLFARFVIIEAPYIDHGYEPKIMEIPGSLIDACRDLYEYKPEVPGIGPIGRVPDKAEITECGERAKVEAVCYAENQRKKSFNDSNDMTGVVWGKAAENVRKFALIHALSADPRYPIINNESMCFARDFVFKNTHNMQDRAREHITDTEEGMQIKKIRGLIQSAGASGLSQRQLTRRSGLKTKTLNEVLGTLAEQEYIKVQDIKNPRGRPTKRYFFDGE